MLPLAPTGAAFICGRQSSAIAHGLMPLPAGTRLGGAADTTVVGYASGFMNRPAPIFAASEPTTGCR